MVEMILQSIGALALILLTLYLSTILKYANGEEAIFRSVELFSKEKSPTDCRMGQAEKLEMEKRVAMLKTWILLQSKKDTALPKWFLEEINYIQLTLSERDQNWFQKIKNEIYAALLAKDCKIKAGQFYQRFMISS